MEEGDEVEEARSSGEAYVNFHSSTFFNVSCGVLQTINTEEARPLPYFKDMHIPDALNRSLSLLLSLSAAGFSRQQLPLPQQGRRETPKNNEEVKGENVSQRNAEKVDVERDYNKEEEAAFV